MHDHKDSNNHREKKNSSNSFQTDSSSTNQKEARVHEGNIFTDWADI